MWFIYIWSILIYQKQYNKSPFRGQAKLNSVQNFSLSLHATVLQDTGINLFFRNHAVICGKNEHHVTTVLQFPWLPIPAFALPYLSFKVDQRTNLRRKKVTDKKKKKHYFFPSKSINWSDLFRTCKTSCINVMEEEATYIGRMLRNIFEIAIWGEKTCLHFLCTHFL